MKSRFLISILLLMAVVLGACTPAATEAKPADAGPIRIGVLAPLSGVAPTYGISHRDAIQVAADEWNAKGGILGRKIELVVEDSQCAPDPAVNAANKLIDQDGVKFMIGEVCSKASVPVAEVADAKKILMITPSSVAESITVKADGSAKQYVFRACFIARFQGRVMAHFAAKQGYKDAFIMSDVGNDYVRDLAEAFEKEWIALGKNVVGKETYNAADTDFSAILTKVAESKAEVLYLPDYYNITNLVAPQAKEKGVTAVIMGGDAWDSADLDLVAADGYYFSNFYSPDDNRPVVVDWVKKYKEKYGAVPDSIATMAYDASYILFQAIENAGSDDPTKVAEAMAKGTFEGVTGKTVFDDKHNPVKGAAILQIKDGKYQFVDNVSPE